MTFRQILPLFACVVVWAAAPSPVRASDDDAKKAQEEIQNIAKNWSVEWRKGTIQYKMQLKLSGKSDEIIGEITGEGVVRVKDKNVRITISVQLTSGKFSYITKYPAMSFTYFGRMTSSDPGLLPIKETIQFQDSLLLKDGGLCPLSVRQNTQCLKPQSK
ncbi:hypothetical protein KKD52_15680 [Myxococcota bacterium]|nr:hypothetical protein [Myxococcota bacterium]MBU1243205.1 hypothetical protein [Myxococcota bacterium]MBU1412793.1 hypothetical protein [Myxococcota bacterium]MBU1511793.1 hypothetical protein [Myxococcota bacterium]